MTSDSTRTASTGVENEVVAAVDDDGHEERYVIADIAAENAWLSMGVTDAPELPAWR